MNAKLKVVRARIIYGAPTVGKTYAAMRLRLEGVNVLDTDEITWVVMPRWFREELWRKEGGTQIGERKDQVVGEVANAALLKDPNSVLFTNLASPAFRGALAPSLLSDGRIPLGIVRKDPQQIHDISRERGGVGIPLSLAKRWFGKRTESWISQAVARVIWLPTGDRRYYMDDVVEFAWPFMKRFDQHFVVNTMRAIG
uniref:Uncharacterized protein n=1 Tax=viral metagenome TaxID=1070528 RepID=A0A2V0R9U9_9ZZZZ